ncbi:MAG: class I SAM-dependent methyltransferase, partial [Alphaproteobacteria bacterium]|nr:class I SAM-dependent methyltransferase [Alphaproteobacteria bacterium]
YATRQPIGAAGDFVTAPEISQVFGELIGLWCAVTWQQMGRPDPFNLVELGPGRGTLIADALRALQTVPACRAALTLHLVESSPVLRQQQRQKMAGVEPQWHGAFDGVPAGPLIVIANEFFDALPIRQFQHTERGWCERRVDIDQSGVDGAAFRLVLAPAPTPGAVLLAHDVAMAPIGSIAELCPAGLVLARQLGDRVAQDGGAALVIDYGYDASQPGETLQAVRNHQPCDALAAPGKADLTAHVDFARLARAARDGGAAVHGPIGQGTWLRRLGIAARAKTLNASAGQRRDIDGAIHRLIDPDEMGRLLRVLVIAHPGLPALAGLEPPLPVPESVAS